MLDVRLFLDYVRKNIILLTLTWVEQLAIPIEERERQWPT